MPVVGPTGRVLYVVSIDDQCDACGARYVLGVCYGARRPVICFECLKGAVTMGDFWANVAGLPPRFTASQVRAVGPSGAS